jgi:flavin reductase (DIM6/NTAB) family NADH-FMN oxidoreductase RutF
MGCVPKGVSVVTAQGRFGLCGMTVSALCSVSLDPPQLLVCLGNQSHTLKVVRTSERFGVNILASDQQDVSKVFAAREKGPDKFDDLPFSCESGTPILDDALAWVVCDLVHLHVTGDHTIAIGSVIAMAHRGGSPLVWHQGDYRRVA